MTYKEEFPEEFYRGLSSEDFITDEGYIKAAAFNFPKTSEREDKFCELSINWKDDSGALKNLVLRHKPGFADQQFKAGYCVVKRELIKQLMLIYGENKFNYERKPEIANEENDYQDNKYHGNLLMSENIDGQVRKNIQHTLATFAQLHRWEEDDLINKLKKS